MVPLLLAAALSAAAPPQRAPLLLDVPFVAQTESLCGGAAMAMVMRYWGDRAVTAEDFSPLVDTASHGIPTSALLKSAAARGWVATVISPTDLADAVDHTRPVIALIEVSRNTYHYVVIVGVTGHDVVMHDPARSPYRTMPRSAFDEASRRAGGWMAVVLPANSIGMAPDPVRCDALVASAITAARNGQTDEASRLLESATFRCPEDPAPWRERAGLAFSLHQYPEAARLASQALALDPADVYTRDLLATSRYLSDDASSALRAWNSLRVNQVDIDGADRTPQSVILSRLDVRPGALLTSRNVERATRRLSDMPSLTDARLTFTPTSGQNADVHVVVRDRPRAPASSMTWAVVAGRAAVAHDVPLTFGSVLNAGDRLDVLWRFQTHREHVGATLAVPSPRGLPGNVELSGLWERQTFAPQEDSGSRLEIAERRRRGGVALSDWANNWFKWRGGAAIDTFDDRRSVALLATGQVRLAGDRFSAGLGHEAWLGGGFSRNEFFTAARTSAHDTSPRLLLSAAVTSVSAGSPRSIWPAADANFSHEGTLRAHPLIDEGIVTGEATGRRLGAATVEYEQPMVRTMAGSLSVAAFVDVAHAWRADAATRLIADAGIGLRIRARRAGAIRIDVAAGLNSHARQLSVGFLPAWPR